MSDESKSMISQEVLSKKRYARIASWNVACMNNFDLPTTIEQVDIKINNIAKVIITSHCDIVALQELPYIITLKRNEERRQETFDYMKEKLENALFQLSQDKWIVEWSTSFYESNDARKGRGVLAFVYNSDIVESQHPFNMELRVNDQRNEDNRVKRMPICGSFRIHMLEFIL